MWFFKESEEKKKLKEQEKELKEKEVEKEIEKEIQLLEFQSKCEHKWKQAIPKKDSEYIWLYCEKCSKLISKYIREY